ncbi:MAG: tRNA 2-thiouridine(34) synthase MnmA, partial [Acidobacteria bacterium]
SHEICFVPDGDYAGVVSKKAGTSAPPPGFIVGTDGAIVGRHEGIHRYTVGQRRGLAVSGRGPWYVTAIRSETNTVVVGRREDLERTSVTALRVNWVSGRPPDEPIGVSAQIRYRHPAAPASLHALPGDRMEVTFDQAQSAVAPGQALVCYVGDEVVGGGWIV